MLKICICFSSLKLLLSKIGPFRAGLIDAIMTKNRTLGMPEIGGYS
jgi:hypothetical protein